MTQIFTWIVVVMEKESENDKMYKLFQEIKMQDATCQTEEPEIKWPEFFGLERKQGNPRKTSTSASLTTRKTLCESQQAVENS